MHCGSLLKDCLHTEKSIIRNVKPTVTLNTMISCNNLLRLYVPYAWTNWMVKSNRCGRLSVSNRRWIPSDQQNQGFRTMVHTLEPRYIKPSCRLLPTLGYPNSTTKPKTKVMESVRKAGRVAVTCCYRHTFVSFLVGSLQCWEICWQI